MALRPISRIDEFEFPEGAFDVRRWTVRTEVDGEKVGRVEDVLLDRTGGMRYLDVDLGFLKKHVLVPLDHAHADPLEETVWIEKRTREDLESVPEYALDPEALDEDYERRIDAVYGGTSASTHRNLVATHEADVGELDLRRLSDIEGEYRIAGDDPRDWTVLTADGVKVGEVVELLVEPGAMKARFIDVALDEKELELEPVDRHVLFPLERVRLNRKKKKVVVGGLMAADLGEYPQYGGLPVSGRHTRELHDRFERAALAGGVRDDVARTEPSHPDWRETTLRHFYRPGQGGRARTTQED